MDAPSSRTNKAAKGKPMVHGGFFSSILMTYITPLLWLGSQRPLMSEDLGEVLPVDSAELLTATFLRHWRAEVDGARERNSKHPQRKKPFQPSMSTALRRTLGLSWILAIVAFFVSAGLQFLPPLILQQLVGYLQGTQKLDTAGAWMDVVALLVVPLLSSILATYHNNVMARVGTQMRTALTGAIYSKALTLRQTGEYTTGEIVNRMAVDAALPLRFVAFASMVFVAPFQIAVAIWLIYRYVGVATFAGLGLIVVSVPISGIMVKSLFKLRFGALREADTRVKLTNEALTGIRVLKFYAWERPYEAIINAVREKELAMLEAAAYAMQVNLSLLMLSLPVLLPVITFAVYTALGNTLDAGMVFATISFFNIIR